MGLYVKSIFKSVRLDKKILDFKPAQTDSLAFVNPIILTIPNSIISHHWIFFLKQAKIFKNKRMLIIE